jgi:hypothetical protein
MPSSREDYLLRILTQVGEAVSRLRTRLDDGATTGEMIPAIRSAEGDLLREQADLLRALDPATAARILGSRRQLQLWIDLLRLEAEVYRNGGHPSAATALETRASQLEQQLEQQRA